MGRDAKVSPGNTLVDNVPPPSDIKAALAPLRSEVGARQSIQDAALFETSASREDSVPSNKEPLEPHTLNDTEWDLLTVRADAQNTVPVPNIEGGHGVAQSDASPHTAKAKKPTPTSTKKAKKKRSRIKRMGVKKPSHGTQGRKASQARDPEGMRGGAKKSGRHFLAFGCCSKASQPLSQ